MRYAALAVTVLCVLPVSASELGQPLDCSDIVFDAPGFTCTVFAPFGVPSAYGSYFTRGSNMSIDNEGSMLIVVNTDVNGSIEIRRTRDGGMTDERLGRIGFRGVPGDPTYYDKITVQWPSGASALAERSVFDPVNGRLLIPLTSYCEQSCPSGYGGGPWVAAIEGFATLYEVRQQYVPQSEVIGFRVPVMPEGMPAADSFSTFYGPLTKPLDFAAAQPLVCDYPASPPSMGDYLSVSDTVPTPAPGQGVYYLTSATYQGQTRYGRKTTAGVQTGRDTALLPACAPATTPPPANPLRLAQLRWYDTNRAGSTLTTMNLAQSIIFDGDHLWVAGRDSGGNARVAKVRASDAALLGAFPVPGNEARGLAFDGTRIWVTDPNGTLTRLRASDGALLGSMTIPGGTEQLAFDGEHIWVGGGSQVTKVRASDAAVQGTFNVGTTPMGMVFDGTSLWISNFNSHTVSKLRPTDGAVLATIPVAPFPFGIAFDGESIWAVSNGDPAAVTKIRAVDAVVLQSIPLTQTPRGIAFDGKDIWVAHQNNNRISRIRTSDGAILSVTPTGDGPRAVAFDGANIWTANLDGSLSKL